MKLGILVVYLVSKENAPLLDLHLRYIENYTQVPYTIYASMNRLLPELREKLEQHPKVKICECPTTELRDIEEHSYYLDRLAKTAVDDGATYLVTLHVDSFPVREDWVAVLTSKLTASCALATIRRIDTGCLIFHRDFWLQFHPTFYPTPVERATPRFAQFSRDHDLIVHSGMGYCYRAYCEGLTWKYLQETNKGGNTIHGALYDDIIFHLMGANRLHRDRSKIKSVHIPSLLRAPLNGAVRWTRRLFRPLLPEQLWAKITLAANESWVWDQLLLQAREQLLQNPGTYMHYLRTGRKSAGA